MNRKTFPSARSTANVGGDFENLAQSLFTVLMLTRGSFSHLPAPWQVAEMQFQTKKKGYATSDLLVIFRKPDGKEERKMLVEIKLSIKVQERKEKAQNESEKGEKKEKGFEKVLMDAWKDFCNPNPEIFQKGRDSIALITGPLSAVDTAVLRYLFNDTKYKNDAGAIRQETALRGATPPKTAKKHQIILNILQKANAGKRVSEQEFKDFADHFHLFFMDSEDGLNGSISETLLIDLVSQFRPENPDELLAKIRGETQNWNGKNGDFTVRNLPKKIRDVFEHGPVSKHFVPEKFSNLNDEFGAETIISGEALFLARAILIGAWNDQNENDQSIASELLNKSNNYDVVSEQAKKILNLSLHNLPLTYKGEIWRVKNRAELWETMGVRLIDSDIDAFKRCAIKALKEINPDSDISSERKNTVNYSQALRKGIAEGLAIIGSSPNALKKCKPNKGKEISESAVREVLSSADSAIWEGLDNLLPILAEAAPDVFLDGVEKSLYRDSSPLGELLVQDEEEESELIGYGYMTGTIWAMECLAWDGQYLVRVCAALGKMANFGADGQGIAAPFNSLVKILMPWLPQTEASQEKREAAARVILRKFPEIALRLFPLFLPGSHQMVSDTYKPKWRNPVPENRNLEKEILLKDYQKEVSFYSGLIVEAVGGDIFRFVAILSKISRFPEEKFNQMVDSLDLSSFASIPEKEQFSLWKKLVNFMSEHRDYKESEQKVALVEKIAIKLDPKSDFYSCLLLFGYNENLVLDGKGTVAQQYENLHERRDAAIAKLFAKKGIESVIRLIKESASFPRAVGVALGAIDNKKIDKKIFPEFLDSDDIVAESFVAGVINRKFKDDNAGWEWFDCIVSESSWTPAQIGRFLGHLDFNKKTWEQSSKLLKENEKEYWSQIRKKPAIHSKLDAKELSYGVGMLIKHGNGILSLEILRSMGYANLPVDINQCVQTLLCLADNEVKVGSGGSSILNEMIRHVHRSGDSVNKEDALKIERYFMRWLDFYPKYHAMEMADDPEFFCKIVRRESPSSEEEKHEDLDGILASNSWKLLREWKDFPGTSESGKKVEVELLKDWLNRARKICEDKKHRKSALHYIGRVLAHVPADPSGLWINRDVAEILNEAGDDGDLMRSGFAGGLSSLGDTVIVGRTGEPERKLAEGYRKQADEVENAGFELLAKKLREMADYYDEERNRVMAPEGEND